MATQAFLAALGEISRVIHPRGERFLVCPVALSVWTEPCGGRPMAVFTAYAFAQIKGSSSLCRRYIERMAGQAFWRRFSFAHAQNRRHSLADCPFQRRICLRVFILDDPCAVFVLQHTIFGARSYAPVAGTRRTRTRSRVSRDLAGLPHQIDARHVTTFGARREGQKHRR